MKPGYYLILLLAVCSCREPEKKNALLGGPFFLNFRYGMSRADFAESLAALSSGGIISSKESGYLYTLSYPKLVGEEEVLVETKCSFIPEFDDAYGLFKLSLHPESLDPKDFDDFVWFLQYSYERKYGKSLIETQGEDDWYQTRHTWKSNSRSISVEVSASWDKVRDDSFSKSLSCFAYQSDSIWRLMENRRLLELQRKNEKIRRTADSLASKL